MIADFGEPCEVLMAEDDPDDRFIIESVFQQSGMRGSLRFVPDGEALMDYLRRQGGYRDQDVFPQPHLLLLDLNMPRKDGRTALAEIRREPELRDLPIVILTTSSAERDEQYCKRHGVCQYISKPTSMDGLLALMETIKRFCAA